MKIWVSILNLPANETEILNHGTLSYPRTLLKARWLLLQKNKVDASRNNTYDIYLNQVQPNLMYGQQGRQHMHHLALWHIIHCILIDVSTRTEILAKLASTS